MLEYSIQCWHYFIKYNSWPKLTEPSRENAIQYQSLIVLTNNNTLSVFASKHEAWRIGLLMDLKKCIDGCFVHCIIVTREMEVITYIYSIECLCNCAWVVLYWEMFVNISWVTLIHHPTSTYPTIDNIELIHEHIADHDFHFLLTMNILWTNLK